MQNRLPVNMHVSCLTDAMTAILSLGIHGRIPIRIVKYDCISPREVNADTTGTSRQDEAKNPAVGVEALHQYLKKLYSTHQWNIFFNCW